MVSSEDFRDYVNPHPSCSEQVQRQAIGPGGVVYVEDKTGAIVDAIIRSVRNGSTIRVMWLFNLAPIFGSPRGKRAAVAARVTEIHRRGGSVLEMATGQHSDKHLAAMVMRASEMVGNHARGAAGKAKRGRPKLFRAPEELRTMKAEWHSRKNATIEDAIAVMENEHHIETNKNELYRLFGPRG